MIADAKTKAELDLLYDSVIGMSVLMPQVVKMPKYQKDMQRVEALILEGYSFSQSLQIMMEENRKAEHETK